jgi:hypothetical protein
MDLPPPAYVAQAVRRIATGQARPAEFLPLFELGLFDPDQGLTETGRAIEEAFLIQGRPDLAKSALRNAYAQAPMVQVLLQGLHGRGATPIEGALYLLEKHGITAGTPDDLRRLRAILLMLNPFDLLKFAPKTQTVRSVTVSEEREAPAVRVIEPHRPYSNLQQLRETLRACNDFIVWIEPHFPRKGLEPLAEEADSTRIKRVRILSGKANADERTVADYHRFQTQMKHRGIRAEWRILDPPPTHDRYIITKDAAWNVPPVNTLYKGDFSEIIKTTTKPPFEMWWKKAAELA